jgi:ribosome-associated translation inhibitor RaiA
MMIQVNTDRHVTGDAILAERVEASVEHALQRFRDDITRLEVHLGDENSTKSGADDKRCMMEARVEGLRPMAVTHHAATLHDAIEGAADKMKSALESTLGRRRER